MEYFNATFLEKKLVKVFIQPGTIWVKLIKAKYFKNRTNFLYSNRPNGASISWKIILDNS